MPELKDDTREELAETLYDLNHDLGKYIKLPLAMLPKDATQTQIARAVRRGIDETRNGPRGVVSAEMLIDRFDSEWGELLRGRSTYDALKQAVERAVAWAAIAVDEPESLPRETVMADLNAVSEAISMLLSEVEGG